MANLINGFTDPPYGIKELGYTFLTELAREIQQIQADPLAQFLPQRAIQEKQIRVEWVEHNLRLLGAVKPGMPNTLNTFAKARAFTAEPAYFRRGQFIDQDTINHLRAPGTINKQYGMDLVQEHLTDLIEQSNMMMAILRAQLFSAGSINYTDPETGVAITAPGGVPAGNLYTIGGGVGPFGASVGWHDPAAKPVTDLHNLVFRAELAGRNRPTHLIANGALLHVLSLNNEVRQYLPNNLSGLWHTGLVQFGEDGIPTRIAGLEIVRCSTVYDQIDPSTGVLSRQYMFPVDTVTLFAPNHSALPGQLLGRTYLTKGEHPDGANGATGIWVRTFPSELMGGPTAAPGVGMQVGMSGLPVFHKPWWVHIVKCADKAAITAITGNKFVV